MKRGMIDIETLSSQSDAAVVSIGLVGFDDTDILFRQSFAILTEDWHGHIDPRTVKWWMEQGADAQAFSFRNPEPRMAVQAALLVQEFALNYCQQECWANGPQFDLVVLRNWWRRTMGADTFPVRYRAYRDCRTLWRSVEDRVQVDLSEGIQVSGVAHDPLYDAEWQARKVQKAFWILDNP